MGVLAFVHGYPERLDQSVGAVCRKQRLCHQFVGIQLARARVLADLIVHERLRERRGVLFVVSELAEAHDVDHHILGELLAVVQRDLRGQHDRFRIVAVHVQHGRFDHLHDVGAIQRRAGVARVAGGEADLVVDDHMHRAAGEVAARLSQRQRLHDHTLAGKGRIAVHEDGQHRMAGDVATAVQPRLDRAFDHRVDDFEVRRIERETQVHRTARGGDIAGKALVVLDVTGWQVLGRGVIELGEQLGRGLAQRVDQHVQSAAVGHADHDFLHARHTGALHEFIHRGDEALAAFEREPLLPHVFGVQVALQTLGCGELLKDVLLLVGREVRLGADRLEPHLPPALFGRVGDVHVLGTDRAAVGFAQRLQDLPQRHVLGGREIGVRGAERDVHVGLAQVVEGGLELGNLRSLLTLERVQIGPARAEEAVGRDQRLHVNLLARDGKIGTAGLGSECVGLGSLCERFDHRRMSHVALIGAIDRRQVLQRVEVGTPVFGHRTRVVEIGLVHLFYVWRIATVQMRVRPVFLHHFAHLVHRFPAR